MNRTIYKVGIVFALLVCAVNIPFVHAWSATVQNVDQAVYLAEQTLLPQGKDNVIMYSWGPVAQGTEIRGTLDQAMIAPATGYAIYIDEIPTANLFHPVRYAFVNANTGEVTQVAAMSPPENLDDYELVETAMSTKLLFAENRRAPVPPAPAGPPRDASNLWAVLINGGHDKYSNHPRYWNDLSNIYITLNRVYGYPDENIIVLCSDGVSRAPDQSNGQSSDLDLDGDGDDDIMYTCNVHNLNIVFAQLADQLTVDDKLFIFATDHGTTNGDWESFFCLWAHDVMPDDYFAGYLDALPACEIICTFEPCYSGGFLDDVIIESGPMVASTACQHDEVSWALLPECEYDAYAFHWTAAVKGEDAYGTPVDADYNGDEIVSMTEAFQYAEAHDLQEEHPQYAEYPPGVGTTMSLGDMVIPEPPTEVEVTASAYNNGPAQYVWLVLDESIGIDHVQAPAYGTVEISTVVDVGVHTFEIFGDDLGFGYAIAEDVYCSVEGQHIDVGMLSQTEHFVIPYFHNNGQAQLADLYINGEGPIATVEASADGWPGFYAEPPLFLEEGVYTFEVRGRTFGTVSAERAVQYDSQQIYIGELNEFSEIDLSVFNDGPSQVVRLFVDETERASQVALETDFVQFSLDIAPGLHDFKVEGDNFGIVTVDHEDCPEGYHYIYMGSLDAPLVVDHLGNWSVNEGAGDRVYDSSGYNHHGRLGAHDGLDPWDPDWTAGISLYALDFDADFDEDISNEDFLTVPDSPGLDITDELTIEAWVKRHSITGDHSAVVAKDASYILEMHNKIRLWIRPPGSPIQGWCHLDSILTPVNNVWYHIAGTFNSATGEWNLYINGTVDNSATIPTGGINITDNPLVIGGCCYGDCYYAFFNGIIDETRVYSRALGDEEILAHYREHGGTVDPDQSYVALTAENQDGLTTCPQNHGVTGTLTYEYVLVTVKNTLGAPIPGVAADEITFDVSPGDGCQYYEPLICTVVPVDPVTDANGQIRFTVQGDVSIQGFITVVATVMETELNDADDLLCNSYDYNVDGVVGLVDFGMFAGDWGTTCWESDFDWDGSVTLIDFGMFASHWGHHT